MRSYARKLLLPLLIVAASCSVTLVAYRAFAQDAAPSAAGPGVAAASVEVAPAQQASIIVTALTSRNWIPLQAALLMLVVWVLRHEKAKLVKLVPWFGKTLGGWFLAFALPLATSLGVGLSQNGHWSMDLFTHGVITAIGAVVGWTALSDAKAAKVSSTEAKTDPGKPVIIPPAPPAA